LHLKSENAHFTTESFTATFEDGTVLTVPKPVIVGLVKKEPFEVLSTAELLVPVVPSAPIASAKDKSKLADTKGAKESKERPRSKLAAKEEESEHPARPSSARLPPGLDVCVAVIFVLVLTLSFRYPLSRMLG
jgi:hypothetical protein